jgi:hypothetical protein
MQVCGKEISRYLPTGARQVFWRRLLTELQMLLHQSPINQQRAQQGSRVFNSVWLWGEGELPRVNCNYFQGVWSDAALVQGLARHTNTPCWPKPADLSQLCGTLSTQPGHYLVVFDELCRSLLGLDVMAWQQQLQRLEEDWFAPLITALKENHLDAAILYVGTRALSVTRQGLRKFWRRKQTMEMFL